MGAPNSMIKAHVLYSYFTNVCPCGIVHCHNFPLYVQGAFFKCSALKMTKCQPDREISELFLPKKRLRMKKVKVPELFRTVPLPKMTKEKVQVTQLLW